MNYLFSLFLIILIILRAIIKLLFGAALRRGVWRAWAETELLPRRRERQHSSYQLDRAASPSPDRPALAGLARGWLQAAATAAARSLCGRPGGAGGCVADDAFFYPAFFTFSPQKSLSSFPRPPRSFSSSQKYCSDKNSNLS